MTQPYMIGCCCEDEPPPPICPLWHLPPACYPNSHIVNIPQHTIFAATGDWFGQAVVPALGSGLARVTLPGTPCQLPTYIATVPHDPSEVFLTLFEDQGGGAQVPIDEILSASTSIFLGFQSGPSSPWMTPPCSCIAVWFLTWTTEITYNANNKEFLAVTAPIGGTKFITQPVPLPTDWQCAMHNPPIGFCPPNVTSFRAQGNYLSSDCITCPPDVPTGKLCVFVNAQII